MKVGRPTKYKPEYCQMLVEHMKQGFSFECFGAVIDCSEDALYDWKNLHKEFSEAYKKGRMYSMKFWEDLGVVGTTEGNHFNATSWIFNMKNRFGWRDRTDITSGDKQINPVPIFGGITNVSTNDSDQKNT